jgi:hypothetical protein
LGVKQAAEEVAAQRLTSLLRRNPTPEDEEVHGLAGRLGMKPDELEELAYKMLAGKLVRTPDIKHGDDPDSNFNPKQLEEGVRVEKEHTDDIPTRAAIAKGHLAEIPDYYLPWLKDMESAAKKEAAAKLLEKVCSFEIEAPSKDESLMHRMLRNKVLPRERGFFFPGAFKEVPAEKTADISEGPGPVSTEDLKHPSDDDLKGAIGREVNRLDVPRRTLQGQMLGGTAGGLVGGGLLGGIGGLIGRRMGYPRLIPSIGAAVGGLGGGIGGMALGGNIAQERAQADQMLEAGKMHELLRRGYAAGQGQIGPG